MEKFPKSKHIIRFQDCDPMAHLNNSRYIDYMINAREDHLKDFYNLDVYARIKTDKRGWVVAKNEILYKRPALLMEEVIISSQVIEYSLKHIKVEINMFNEAEKELKAILWSVFVPFDMVSMRADSHQKHILELLEKVHAPVNEKLIEERVVELSK